MSQKKLTVVLSQAQGKDPNRRAIEEEIAAAQTPTLTVNEVIIDLVTRQVEVMSEEEKSELLTLLNG